MVNPAELKHRGMTVTASARLINVSRLLLSLFSTRYITARLIYLISLFEADLGCLDYILLTVIVNSVNSALTKQVCWSSSTCGHFYSRNLRGKVGTFDNRNHKY